MMNYETAFKPARKQKLEERKKQAGRVEAYSDAIRELLKKKDREKK
ncbi:MAG: hypothetical protein LUD12_10570 [Lachnospiraceae bacterium]|nr:hypothetical protein [Lachnospiraceae bacterium]